MRVSVGLPDGRVLTAEADPALEADARAFLNRLAAPAAAVVPGETAFAAWDWARVRLQASPTTVDAGDADNPDGDAIDLILERLAFQARLLDRLRAVGRPLQPGQYSRIAVDALASAAATAERTEDPNPMFSGWQVQAVADANAVYGLYSTEEIAGLRGFWLPALALPPGWGFNVDDGRLIECRSPDKAVHRLDLRLPGGPPESARRA